MAHTVPALGYDFDALEPHIDAKTMEIHHDKHHQAYVDKLNAALEGHADLASKDVDALVADLDSVPSDIRGAVRNHGGGHSNHSFFWKILKKGVAPSGPVVDAITKKWGSLEKFQEEFEKTALAVFGSGWAWLVIDKGELQIVPTPNQDSPLSKGQKPVLGVDCWEHSYYVRYFNRRDEYLKNWWHVVNWEQANENYKNA